MEWKVNKEQFLGVHLSSETIALVGVLEALQAIAEILDRASPMTSKELQAWLERRKHDTEVQKDQDERINDPSS